MAHPRGESGSDAVRLDFDRRLMLQFRAPWWPPMLGCWGRFETQWLAAPKNFAALADLSGQWTDLVTAEGHPVAPCSTWI